MYQEWSAEGYQLWMLRESPDPSLTEENGNGGPNLKCSLIQLDFVKSPLTINPCMVNIESNCVCSY